VKHQDLKPHLTSSANRFCQAPPPPLTTLAALSSSRYPSSSKGHSSIFKPFKGLVSMCQRTNHRLDVVEQKLDANAYNHRLIHSKLQIEEPFKEVPDAEDLPEPIDPFAFLTPDKLNYFEMGESHLGGGPRGSEDNGSDDDDDDDEGYNDEATE
jgi:hypothetical protein